MRFELAFALIALAAPALAQQDGHAENHDWYKYLNTKSGKSCCNGDRDFRDSSIPFNAAHCIGCPPVASYSL